MNKPSNPKPAPTIRGELQVVTTYRKHLEDGRLTLMSDGKTSKGLPWTLIDGIVDFGREGRALPRAGGAYYYGSWIGGWHINGRVLMNNVTLKTKVAAPVVMPMNTGESMIGTRPSLALKDSLVDLWEFEAILTGTNKFIRLTCDFTPNNLIMDGDRVIGTYKYQKRAVSVRFIDPQFDRVTFIEKQDNVLSGKGKPVNRKFWNFKFTRVQRQAVYRTKVGKRDFVLYTNNRVNSPRYTPDYFTTFYWFHDTVGGKRRLLLRIWEAKLIAGGRELNWNNNKLVLIAGKPPR